MFSQFHVFNVFSILSSSVVFDENGVFLSLRCCWRRRRTVEDIVTTNTEQYTLICILFHCDQIYITAMDFKNLIVIFFVSKWFIFLNLFICQILSIKSRVYCTKHMRKMKALLVALLVVHHNKVLWFSVWRNLLTSKHTMYSGVCNPHSSTNQYQFTMG